MQFATKSPVAAMMQWK